MIKVIGKFGCSNCNRIKQIFNQKNIKYEYITIDTLSDNEQENLFIEAEKNRISSFPIILKDNKIISLEEVLINVH